MKPKPPAAHKREPGLLPAAEVDRLEAEAPKMIVDQQQAHLLGMATPSWHDFIEAFTPETGLDEIPLPGRIPLPVATDYPEGGCAC